MRDEAPSPCPLFVRGLRTSTGACARFAPGARRALLALAAPIVFVAAGAASAGGDVNAVPTVDSKHVSCWDEWYEWEPAVARGAFRRVGEPTRLLLSGGEDGCRIRHEGGRLPGKVSAGGARFVTVCRDAASGRDHAVLHWSSGQHHAVEVWAADPATGNPERFYDEAWGDDAPTEPGRGGE